MEWLIEKLSKEGKIDEEVLRLFRDHIKHQFEQYKEGKIDLHELVDFMESCKDLKTIFAYWISDMVFDELIHFNIKDYVDNRDVFIPYKEDLHIVVEVFFNELLRYL